MKLVAPLITVLLAYASVTANGQGQFIFNNYLPPETDAPFILFCGGPQGFTQNLSGPEWHLELRGGPLATTDPMGGGEPLTPFKLELGSGATAGYIAAPTTGDGSRCRSG